MPADMMAWANAIVSKVATLHTPPNSDEFWKYEENARAKLERSKGNSNRNQGLQPPVPQYVYTTYHPNQMMGLQTPRTQRQQQVEPSPVRKYSPKEYNGDGLYDYLQWHTDKWEDEEYLGLYGKLSGEMLGIDIFKSASSNREEGLELIKELKQEHGVKSGMAKRLVDYFSEWNKTLVA